MWRHTPELAWERPQHLYFLRCSVCVLNPQHEPATRLIRRANCSSTHHYG